MCLLSSKWWTSVDNGELIIKQAEKSAFSVGQSRQKCSQNQKKKNKKKAKLSSQCNTRGGESIEGRYG